MTTPLEDIRQRALGETYHIERELGGGGMSRVFVAEERALGRKVVVKILPPDRPVNAAELVRSTEALPLSGEDAGNARETRGPLPRPGWRRAQRGERSWCRRSGHPMPSAASCC